MSQSVPTQRFSSSPNLPDLADLAEKLQETAQALLASCQRPSEYDDSDEPEGSAESASDLKPPFEIRSYEIPDFILRDEQDLLKKSNSEDLHEVLNKVYGHIYCIANLMSLFPAEETMDGVLVNEVADVLLVPLDWLEQLCSTFVGFRLVHHMKTD